MKKNKKDFPDRIYVSRVDDKDTHYFLAVEELDSNNFSDGDKVATYDLNDVGTLEISTTIVYKGSLWGKGGEK